MAGQQAEAVAREHVRQAVALVGNKSEWDASDHLTAALVFAVLSLNDTLRNLDWQRKATP